ncbi:MAG: sigma-70 family RNA polymerase sigma factor [Anaerolineaceae bacterium]|nr:sigma-70 family RNA polymerase sigma factor [Anaerolineaceae bacterium]
MINLEAEQLTLALQGDEEAFGEVVETFQNPVYNLCYRMLGNAQEAEDAAQETFWRAYQALNRYDQNRSFATWLLSIAAHYCIDQQRKRKLPSFSIELLPEGNVAGKIDTPEKTYFLTEEERHLHLMLNELNPEDKAAIVLRYWYDFSEKEISQTLKLSISAVKSRLHRSRKKLAQIISENEQSHSYQKRRKNNESPAF